MAKNLTLEEKAQRIRNLQHISVRSGMQHYTFEFVSGGDAFVWIKGKKYSVSNPGSTLYAIAKESEYLNLTYSELDGSQKQLFLFQIEIFPRIW